MGQREQAGLIDAFIQQTGRIRSRLARTLVALFSGPGSWRDADVDRFAAQAVPLVEGAQRAAASLTDDYLSRMIADQTGTPFQPHGVDYSRVTGAAVRNGVVPERVYRRPFEDVWRELGEARERAEERSARQAEPPRGALDALDAVERMQRDRGDRGARVEFEGGELPERDRKPLTVAVAGGERHVRSLALTDVELAVTHTARERMADDSRIRFFRRVLTGAESCGLCALAATQRYHKADLLPIHPNCDCVIAPILGDQDPGRIINALRISDDATPTGESRSGVPVFDADGLIDENLLKDDVHDAILQRFGRMAFDGRGIDYRKILLVMEHGELGPVLTVRRHKFTKRQIRDRDLAAGADRRR